MKRFISCVGVCAVLLTCIAPAAFAGGAFGRFSLWKSEFAVDGYNIDITGDGQVDMVGVSAKVEIAPPDSAGMMQARLRLLFHARDSASGQFIGELTPPLTLSTMSFPNPADSRFQTEGIMETYYENEGGSVFFNPGSAMDDVADAFLDDELFLGFGRAFANQTDYIVIGITQGDGPCYSNEATAFECIQIGTYNFFVYDATTFNMVCAKWFESEGPLGELDGLLSGVGDYDNDGSDEVRVVWETETNDGGSRFTYKNFDVTTCARDGAATVFNVRSIENVPNSNFGPTKPVSIPN